MTYRILHIVPSFALGGAAGQVALLATRLPRDEFEVSVCALNQGGPVIEDLRGNGVRAAVIGRRWAVDPVTLWRLRRQIVNARPHLVHTWEFEANSYGRLAARLAGVRRIVAAQRHVDAWKTERQLWLDRRLASWTDRWICSSRAVADFYLRHGLPREKLGVVACGIAVAAAGAGTREALLAELNLPPNARLIASIGALVKHKRLKQLAWAVDQLKALGLPAHWLLIGDGPLREPLRRYVRLNRVADRVHFLGARRDVPRILAHADVLWQAGLHEGQSTGILAAMAAGIPVVAADAPGNRELVVPGQTGYLVPPQEKAGFARWTLPLLENPELAKCLGSAARKRALHYFGADEMAARYREIYRELLAEPRSQAPAAARHSATTL